VSSVFHRPSAASVLLMPLFCASLALAQPTAEPEGSPLEEGPVEPAQPSPSPSETGPASPVSSPPVDVPVSIAPAADLPAAKPYSLPPANEFRHDRESEFENGHAFEGPSKWLEWHGNAQVDVAFVEYRFTDPGVPYEQLYDLRGRFVVGPTLWHAWVDGWFVRARAEFVAWLREINDSYQINVDDAFAQAGKVGLWDVKVGRFFSWRVYHRGPGFDLFTTEDLGACVQGNCARQDPADFAPRMYDVSTIYFRDTPGRAAFHYYPTRWSGIEALVQYGSASVASMGTTTMNNSLGGRLAGMLSFPLLRASAALELRQMQPTADLGQPAEGGGTLPCPACGSSSDAGFGGGVEFTPRALGLELAVNAGYSHHTAYQSQASRIDSASSGEILTVGGYGQFDLGKYVLRQNLVLGAGYNYTQTARENRDYGEQGQLAAYLLWPLDFFQGAAIKFVYTNAHFRSESDDGVVVTASSSDSNAFRLRFSLNY
jgi:hypothetical protein